MKPFISILLYFLLVCRVALAQPVLIDKGKFFSDSTILKATLLTSLNKIIHHGTSGKNTFTSRFICKLPDSSTVNEKILVEFRGHFRRENCFLPPLKLIFNTPDSGALWPLKSLKLVSACNPAGGSNQYLLKEYLSYKIYNLITDKSFRVRLLDLDYQDSSGSKKTIRDYAFFIEDIKDLAKRNNCKEFTGPITHTEKSNRKQMTLLAIFEYMIGNTDWAVPVRHNIKAIQLKGDSTAKPYCIPYDLDYAGLVNATYAVPDPLLNTETVLQRVYRGFPRTMDELSEVLDVFKKQKENIYSLINNFNPLTTRNKKNMIDYLEEFFKIIDDPKDVNSIFIKNARTE